MSWALQAREWQVGLLGRIIIIIIFTEYSPSFGVKQDNTVQGLFWLMLVHSNHPNPGTFLNQAPFFSRCHGNHKFAHTCRLLAQMIAFIIIAYLYPHILY